VVVLDTSFLIALERDVVTAWGRMDALQTARSPLRVPAAVWVEYLFPMAPAERSRAVGVLEASVTFEPFTRALADEAARLQNVLREAGTLLGWHDLQVATTALHHGEAVVSNDAGFARVPGLETLTH
jgi:predicted nucleic acid-binding protein